MAIRATRLEIRVGTLMLLGAGAPISFAAAPLQAQTVTLRPIAHVSVPTKFSLREGTLNVSQKVALRLGARMTLTFNDRFDVTNTVTYTPGSATLYGAGERLKLQSGSHALSGASTARYWLRPQGGPLSWEMHTGVGMVFGGQPSYLDLFESPTMSAVLGTAVRYQWRDLLSFTMKVQHRLLKLRFGEEGVSNSKPLKVAFGVGFPILERLR
jgi:hypothetical protein